MGSTESRSSVRPTLLVVDDDPVHRKLVVRGLEPFGCERVYEAGDGVEAQEILRRQAIDLVITDLRMPRMGGLELIGWAKESCPDPLWVILSGVDTFDAAVDAIHLGAFDFIAKPVGLKQLEVSVHNALRHRWLLGEKQRLDRELQQRNETLQARVVQLQQMCRMLEDQADHINQDLERAEIIQNSLLPRVAPDVPGCRVEALYRPGQHVGGDLYDVANLDGRHIALYVTDATGHGVAAAMLSVLFKQRLQLVDPDGTPRSPARVLQEVNRALIRDVAAPGMFVTAAYALLDTQTLDLRLAVAGHTPALLMHPDGTGGSLPRTGPALGLAADAGFGEQHIRMARGDRLLLYTDGLLDAADLASPHELERSLLRSDMTVGTLLRELFELASRATPTAADDVTMLLLEAQEGESVLDNLRSEPGLPTAVLEAEPGAAVSWGESDAQTYLEICGRGTWAHSEGFYDAALASLAAGRPLTLDLSGCEHLDSTFLGAIHEVVSRAGAQGVPVRVQRVPTQIRDLFDELGMLAVIDSIGPGAPPPAVALKPLAERERPDPSRLLRAHEVLASLSEHNRDQFRAVIEALRAELDA